MTVEVGVYLLEELVTPLGRIFLRRLIMPMASRWCLELISWWWRYVCSLTLTCFLNKLKILGNFKLYGISENIHVFFWWVYHYSLSLFDGGTLELKSQAFGASLVIQWLRICFAMQRTPIWSLDQEDPTCGRANKAFQLRLLKPERLEPVLQNKGSRCSESLRTTAESGPNLLQLEKAPMWHRRTPIAKK